MSTQIACFPLDANNDPILGTGPLNVQTNLDAVATIIGTRLRLFEGEWWADQSDGLPLWQQILGVGQGARQQQQVAALIQARILGTPFVVSLSNVAFSFVPRLYQFSCSVQTQFGTVSVTSTPTPPSGGIS